jgi:predicted O-linked N-acetylglucosamine transferase (SPINDLY family)
VTKPVGSDEQSLQTLLDAAYAAHRAGWLDEAERRYRELLARRPGDPAALHHLGLLAHQRGDTAAGLALLDQALAAEPGNPRIHFNKVTLLRAAGRPAEAEAVYAAAAAAATWDFAALLKEAESLREGEEWGEAVHTARLALAVEPQRPEPCFLIGQVELSRSRPAEALLWFDRALAAAPGHARSLCRRGIALARLGRTEDALTALQQALQADPAAYDAHAALGDLLAGLGRPHEAVTAYRAALAARPDFAEGYFLLGNALGAVADFPAAAAAYREALRHNPADAASHANLANALFQLREPGAAEQAVREAIRQNPELPEAHATLGNILETLRPDEAMAAFDMALRLRPDFLEVQVNRGNLLARRGDVEAGIAAYQAVLAQAPANSVALSNLLFTRNYRFPESRDALFAEHQAYARQVEAPLPEPAPHTNAPDSARRLRVGLISPDFRDHPVTMFLLPWLRQRDSTAIELVCYANVQRPDALTEQVRTLADGWRDLRGLDHEAMASQIREDGVDILIDLAGHLGSNLLPVLARRPAPVQASYLGYLNTTGLTRVDHYLGDALLTPPAAQPWFSETLWPLAGPALCYEPPEALPPVAPLPLLRNGYPTFGCFNNVAKISPEAAATWAGLLRQLPQARLLVRGAYATDETFRRQFCGWLAAEGVAASRVDLVALTPRRADYQADYARIDVALDPFPYNGVTTTCESLSMGVPVVALAGDFGFRQAGASLLTGLGRPEWIAEDAAAYVRIAAALVDEPERLAALRAGLRDEMTASALMDGAAFARRMETALRGMWQRWCAQQTTAP